MERSRASSSLVLLALVIFSGAGVAAATLKPESLVGWSTYVAATERRIQHELSSPPRFLASAFTADAAADRAAAMAGRIVIHQLETRDDQGKAIDVPSALVHHWRGLVLIRGESLDDLFAWIASGAADTGQEEISKASVLERDAGGLTMFLRITRTKIVTAVYDTEHRVTFTRVSPTRAVSTSTSLRIAELADAGTSKERELPPGDDRGFLWRMNAYWRYEQTDQGVLAECESLTLSRDLPPFVGLVLRPIVSGAARESMERTLAALRTRLSRVSETRPASSPVR